MKAAIKVLAAIALSAASLASYAQQMPPADAPYGASVGEHHHHHHHRCGGQGPAEGNAGQQGWHPCGPHGKPHADGDSVEDGAAPGLSV